MLNGLEEILAKYELSDDVKSAIFTDVNGAASGLINKKSELEVKVANKDALTAAEKAELNQLREINSNLEIDKAKTAQDWQKASDLQLQASEEKYSALQSENTAFKLERDNSIIDNGINSKLNSLGVKPESRNDIFNSMKFQTKMIDGKAMVGDQTQSDFIDQWALTDSGKAAISAQNNSGGNGNGGTNTPTGKPLTLTEKAILANQNK